MDIISMAQHARPNASGQSELLRAQFTALSSWLKIMPSFCRTLVRSSGLSRVTLRPPSTLIARASSLFSHEQGRTPNQSRHVSQKQIPRSHVHHAQERAMAYRSLVMTPLGLAP